ncbi:BQ5605_C008g05353 [Microbotryum silenes-dioicae]|uniref:BQ5605_C008g05353 protein n=1 Tax=Microbotryum silenes-dioicae TaxID=796604 RepID=A0A2X0MD60_9BASI|nr:BQ5605_C008g05353 [Microbotryum silenes-dioicae]
MRSSIIVLFTAMVGLVVAAAAAAGGDSHQHPGQSHTRGKKKDAQASKQCKQCMEDCSADCVQAMPLLLRNPRGDASRTLTKYRNNHDTALQWLISLYQQCSSQVRFQPALFLPFRSPSPHQFLNDCSAPVIRIGPHGQERETVQLPELSK